MLIIYPRAITATTLGDEERERYITRTFSLFLSKQGEGTCQQLVRTRLSFLRNKVTKIQTYDYYILVDPSNNNFLRVSSSRW